MRCPDCGARNADAAAWCTQCYRRLEGPTTASAVAPAEVGTGERRPSHVATPSGDDHAAVPTPPSTPPPIPATARAAAERDIRVDGDQVEWRCARCAGWTPLEQPSCAACGSARVGFTPTAAAAATARAPTGSAPLVASALLPGLGHLLVGRPGSGVARILLWLLWAGGAGLTLVSVGVTSTALVLALAASALWAITLQDLSRLADGRPQVLTGRVLAWSVVGVTAALVLSGLAGVGGTPS
jgi:TM2 domain-containing membrane protein YozV